MARPKKARFEIGSRDEANAKLGELREITAELDLVLAKRDRLVARASARYETQINEKKAAAADIETALKSFYYGHISEIEAGGEKFLQLGNGRIGRRDTPPALKPLNRFWGWDAIKGALKAKFGMEYFHPAKEPEVDKEKLKAARLAVQELKDLGLKVEADEKFYAEPAVLPAVEAR